MNMPILPGHARTRTPSRRAAPLGSAVAACALAVASLLAPVALLQPAPAVAQTAVRNLPDFTGLVEQTGAAVVNIRTTERAGSRRNQQGALPEMLDL